MTLDAGPQSKNHPLHQRRSHLTNIVPKGIFRPFFDSNHDAWTVHRDKDGNRTFTREVDRSTAFPADGLLIVQISMGNVRCALQTKTRRHDLTPCFATEISKLADLLMRREAVLSLFNRLSKVKDPMVWGCGTSHITHEGRTDRRAIYLRPSNNQDSPAQRQRELEASHKLGSAPIITARTQETRFELLRFSSMRVLRAILIQTQGIEDATNTLNSKDN